MRLELEIDNTHPVITVHVGEEELVRRHNIALALDAVKPGEEQKIVGMLANLVRRFLLRLFVLSGQAHLSHRTPGREVKHPEKQLIALLNIRSRVSLSGLKKNFTNPKLTVHL